jgi:hypothetical protein
MTYRTITTDVEVYLSEFDTEDLIEELEDRGEWPGIRSGDAQFDSKELLEAIWLKRRVGNNDYQTELDQLIYAALGHVI